MEANDVADAVGGLSISEDRDRQGAPIHQEDETEYFSDSDDSSETIRPGPKLTSMSKSKSADTLRSGAMLNDDVFTNAATSNAEPSQSNAVVLQGDQSIDTTGNVQHFHPRADRGNEINEYNAQGQLPPEAAIFCANLSNHLPPDQLAQHVHRAFDTYGKCYVSVKYDKHQNPYAVIQYEDPAAARDALRTGNYTMIDGRQIRLEQSKGDRAVIITLMDNGGNVSEHEARDVLSRFGEIETIMSTDMIPGRPTSLPRGQYVRFAFFLDCRDALRRLHEFSPNYRIQLAAGLEPKRRIGGAGSEIYTSLGPARNNTDSKSIYVGNLPEDCTDTDVHTAFARFGVVENINLVRKTYPGGALNCFAFVEFSSPADADTAYQTEMWIKNNKLRIEPKEYTARRNQRMAFESPPGNRFPTTPPSQRRIGSGGWRRETNVHSPGWRRGDDNYQSPGWRRGDDNFQSPPPRPKFQISPAASAALQERLADNNHHNNSVTAPSTHDPTPPMMMSPPRYDPFDYGPGYHHGSPDAYRPHFEGPVSQYGGGYYHGYQGGPVHAPPGDIRQGEGGYADPGYTGAAQYGGPPPPPPRYPPYNDTTIFKLPFRSGDMTIHTLSGLSLVLFLSFAGAQICPSGYAPASGSPPPSEKAITWEACGTEDEPRLECALLDVPLDWTDPNAGTLPLPLVRLPASDPNPRNRSIIFNPGGPGSSGIAQFVKGGGGGLANDTGHDFHYVSFDPRGVGLNIPYLCPDVGQNSTDPSESDFVAPSYIPPISIIPDTDEWFEAQYENNLATGKSCASGTYEQLGELIGTAFVARDVNAIAEALGEDGLIRYWGFSYGTLLGSTIAFMFPEKVDRIVLDGNINPTDYYIGLGAEAVANFDAAIEYFFISCAEAGPEICALAEEGKSGQDLLDQILGFYNTIRDQGITLNATDSESVLTYQDIGAVLGDITKSGRSVWAESAAGLAALYNSQAPLLSNAEKRQTPSPAPFDPTLADDPKSAVLSAITCGDASLDFGTVDGDTFRSYQELYQQYSKYGYESLLGIIQACATWQVAAKEQYKGPFENIETRTPILFVNGPYDPVTPLVSAQNSSHGFLGSAVLQHTGTGHCSSADPSLEVNAKVKSYFQTGELPDVSTIAQPNILPFEDLRSPGSGSLAKRSPEELEEIAVLEAASQRFHRRVEAVDYPPMLMEAKRNALDMLRKRASTSARAVPSVSCTPIEPTSSPTSTGEAQGNSTAESLGVALRTASASTAVVVGMICLVLL
ncbi:Tripeptidyl aminopeptidase [Cyphellophora attinorum]|uniref:Tripeptidyl aminopeptidase n=1 Tax=Cyphellophora attinorum TaxID=1664694 RepID=A0A0N1HV20_9EURO|nr:Tripeptidyl aminopeptidase [Phialophora attinorum]KPI43443.1 Tripeptidyl aminopeptidase [Phialophora attinorum]